MKIIELLNIEKAVEMKSQELEEKKRQLEELRSEVEEIKLMIEINTNQGEKIDIRNVYIFRENGSNVTNFVRRIKSNVSDHYSFINIFTGELLYVRSRVELTYAKIHNWKYDYIESIKEVYSEVNVYLDGKVPKLLLQKLYYEANNIDEKVLKRGAMKD